MTVLKISTDTWQTYLGLFESVIFGLVTYILTLGPGYEKVLICLGGALAVSRAVKGFLAAGIKAEVKPSESGDQKVDVVVDPPKP